MSIRDLILSLQEAAEIVGSNAPVSIHALGDECAILDCGFERGGAFLTVENPDWDEAVRQKALELMGLY